jgi:hypothetical protein
MPMSALQRRISNKARLGGKPKIDKVSVKEKILKRKGKIEAERDITAKNNLIAGGRVIIGHGTSGQKLDVNTKLEVNGGIQFSAITTAPASPPKGTAVLWIATGALESGGADGDVMIKITNSSGSTKTATLAEFSAL